MVAGAGRADDARAEGDRDLDGEVADAAGGRVHEHRLTGPHPQRPDQRLVRGEPGQREAAGLRPVQRGRLAGEGADGGGDQLGVRPVLDTVLADVAEDLVADRELGDRAADRADHPGQVPAHDEREVRVQDAVEVPLADLPVDRVHPGRPDLYEHRVRPELRVRQVGELDDLGAAVLPDRDCLHPSSQPAAGPDRAPAHAGRTPGRLRLVERF